jgi:hypothetical protein
MNIILSGDGIVESRGFRLRSYLSANRSRQHRRDKIVVAVTLSDPAETGTDAVADAEPGELAFAFWFFGRDGKRESTRATTGHKTTYTKSENPDKN